MSTVLPPSLSAEREQPANRPPRIAPTILNIVRLLHGPTAADRLAARA